MPVVTLNVMFFNFDDDRHTYYLVEDGDVQYMGERIREADLPQRIEAMRQWGVESVYVFVHRIVPPSLYEWMHSELGYKQVISTSYMQLKPSADSVESWIQQAKWLMSEKEAEFAELSVTAVKE